LLEPSGRFENEQSDFLEGAKLLIPFLKNRIGVTYIGFNNYLYISKYNDVFFIICIMGTSLNYYGWFLPVVKKCS
jgi:hypothetical protein